MKKYRRRICKNETGWLMKTEGGGVIDAVFFYFVRRGANGRKTVRLPRTPWFWSNVFPTHTYVFTTALEGRYFTHAVRSEKHPDKTTFARDGPILSQHFFCFFFYESQYFYSSVSPVPPKPEKKKT